MLKIGLGYLGKIHLKLIAEMEEYELSGVYDIDKDLCNALANQYNVKAFHDLIDSCEFVSYTKQYEFFKLPKFI